MTTLLVQNPARISHHTFALLGDPDIAKQIEAATTHDMSGMNRSIYVDPEALMGKQQARSVSRDSVYRHLTGIGAIRQRHPRLAFKWDQHVTLAEWQGAPDPAFRQHACLSRSLDIGLVASSRTEMLFGPGVTLRDLVSVFDPDCEDCLLAEFSLVEHKLDYWHLQIDARYEDHLEIPMGTRHVSYAIRQGKKYQTPMMCRESCYIHFGKNRGTGIGSHLFMKSLAFDHRAPHVQEARIKAMNVGRYAWRHLPLILTADDRKAIQDILSYINDQLDLHLSPQKIDAIRSPRDVSGICTGRKVDRRVLDFVQMVATHWQDHMGLEDHHFTLTPRQIQYIVKHPGILALMMMPNYDMGWKPHNKAHITLS